MITAAVMHMGEMTFKQRGREEQAESDGEEVSSLLILLLILSETILPMDTVLAFADWRKLHNSLCVYVTHEGFAIVIIY